MKKLIAISGLAFFLIFSCGSFFIYKLYLKSYKKEFRSFIIDTKLKDLQVHQIERSELYQNSSEMIWIDGNKEVIINGELYDVMGVRETMTEIQLVLLPDKHEKEIKIEFASLFNDQDIESGGLMKLIKKLLSFKYLTNHSRSLVAPLESFCTFVLKSSGPVQGHFSAVFVPPNN